MKLECTASELILLARFLFVGMILGNAKSQRRKVRKYSPDNKEAYDFYNKCVHDYRLTWRKLLKAVSLLKFWESGPFYKDIDLDKREEYIQKYDIDKMDDPYSNKQWLEYVFGEFEWIEVKKDAVEA